MTQDDISAGPPGAVLLMILVVGSALAYTGSMAAMKAWAVEPGLRAGLFILICLAVAIPLEILLLRTQRLGMIYVSILAVEVVLIALVSVLIFREGYSVREVCGCGLVIAGTALAWS